MSSLCLNVCAHSSDETAAAAKAKDIWAGSRSGLGLGRFLGISRNFPEVSMKFLEMFWYFLEMSRTFLGIS